jgi:hypothetical protein
MSRIFIITEEGNKFILVGDNHMINTEPMMLYVEKQGMEDLTRTIYPSDALDTLNRAEPLILLGRFVHTQMKLMKDDPKSDQEKMVLIRQLWIATN